MSETQEVELRADLVRIMMKMAMSGLNRGTSGNASVRFGDGMLVTPSGIVPDKLVPESIVFVDADGTTAPDAKRPSSEWRMHRRILDQRPDVNAVVHCHSRHATILACSHKPIKAIHYMVGVSGGVEIPVAPYATFGTGELADAVVAALDGRLACLMANHGQIALGRSIDNAYALAEEVEEQAAVYYGTLLLGEPHILTSEQMQDIFGQFSGYGQKR